MNLELSIIDLHYLLNELKHYEGSLVDTIHQCDEELFIRLYHKEHGKPYLVITKRLIFLSKNKKDSPTLHGFCALLRKHLARATLQTISIIPGDRIVKLVFSREQEYTLYAEFYGRSNIVLCNQKNLIVGSLRRTTTVQAEEEYIPQPKENILSWTPEDITRIFSTTEDNVSKTLAKHIGRQYSFELCSRAGIDPKEPRADNTLIHHTLHSLFTQEVQPTAYTNVGGRQTAEDSRPTESIKTVDDERIMLGGQTVAITPFPFATLSEYHATRYPTLSKAYEDFFATTIVFKPSTHSKKATQLEDRIKVQQKRLKELEHEVQDNQRKGELIYENYQELNKIIEGLKEARKTMSWKEIKEKIKNKKIKKIDEKTGDVTVEV